MSHQLLFPCFQMRACLSPTHAVSRSRKNEETSCVVGRDEDEERKPVLSSVSRRLAETKRRRSYKHPVSGQRSSGRAVKFQSEVMTSPVSSERLDGFPDSRPSNISAARFGMKVEEEFEADRETQPKGEITITPRSQPQLQDLVCLPSFLLFRA